MTLPRRLHWGAPAAGVALFFPVAVAGLAALGLGLLAAGSLRRSQWTQLLRAEIALVLLVGWLALSAAWSPAPWAEIAVSCWRYLALAFVAILAAATPARTAALAWHIFIAAAAAMALAQLAGIARWVPPDAILASMFHYTGNKSIGNGVLLAVAAAAAMHLALQPTARGVERAGLGGAVALIVLALALRSASRTSLVVLAVLTLALCVMHWRLRRMRWLALGLAAGVSALAWTGGGGLAMREAAGQLEQSNRYRMEIYDQTWAMVAERPLLGQGVGSWRTVWQQRNRNPELQDMNTAHQEWLQTAQQGGVGAALLLLAVFGGWWRQALRAGAAGAGGLGVLCLIAWLMQTMVNAAIRDASFAAPMILLLGLALALARGEAGRSRGEEPARGEPHAD